MSFQKRKSLSPNAIFLIFSTALALIFGCGTRSISAAMSFSIFVRTSADA
jgi:hypothetical protein